MSLTNRPIQQLGLYEKALPTTMALEEKITIAKNLGFTFIELSIDESDARLERLNWTQEERLDLVKTLSDTSMRIPSICLSGHRRYPLGSKDKETREKALEIMKQAIDLADDLGTRVIQLAGYDVYYEEKTLQSRQYFIENLKVALAWADAKQITLAIEIMDDPFINSIQSFLEIQDEVGSKNLKVYPDLGNLSAWPENNVGRQLYLGRQDTVAVHIKDTLAVTDSFPGKFKNVPFDTGCVDFAGCFISLNQLNYNGPYVIEMWTSENKEDDIEAIQNAKKFVLSEMKKGGLIYG